MTNEHDTPPDDDYREPIPPKPSEWAAPTIPKLSADTLPKEPNEPKAAGKVPSMGTDFQAAPPERHTAPKAVAPKAAPVKEAAVATEEAELSAASLADAYDYVKRNQGTFHRDFVKTHGAATWDTLASQGRVVLSANGRIHVTEL